MENLGHWNNLCRPPEQALKRIAAGRLKGMSDINPQWRCKAMTEEFGPCGIGWKFTITKQWIENGMDQEQPVTCAFVNIELFIFHEGMWSEPIPGTGGSMLVAKEKYGPHTSDECYKMAVTDALSTAMKMLGVAADIYMGMFDGSKYTTPDPKQTKPAPAPVKPAQQYGKADAEKLLVDHQEVLTQPQIEWASKQIAAENYDATVAGITKAIAKLKEQ